MPTATETPARLWAHCQNGQCPGNKQEQVDGFKNVTSFSYIDNGGDLPGEERSIVDLRWHDESESTCDVCGGPRELADQERPVYHNLSGHDPMGLFQFKGQVEHKVRDLEHQQQLDGVRRDGEVEALKAQLATLTALIAERGAQPPAPAEPAGEQTAPKVGRPRKTPSE